MAGLLDLPRGLATERINQLQAASGGGLRKGPALAGPINEEVVTCATPGSRSTPRARRTPRTLAANRHLDSMPEARSL